MNNKEKEKIANNSQKISHIHSREKVWICDEASKLSKKITTQMRSQLFLFKCCFISSPVSSVFISSRQSRISFSFFFFASALPWLLSGKIFQRHIHRFSSYWHQVHGCWRLSLKKLIEYFHIFETYPIKTANQPPKQRTVLLNKFFYLYLQLGSTSNMIT